MKVNRMPLIGPLNKNKAKTEARMHAALVRLQIKPKNQQI